MEKELKHNDKPENPYTIKIIEVEDCPIIFVTKIPSYNSLQSLEDLPKKNEKNSNNLDLGLENLPLKNENQNKQFRRCTEGRRQLTRNRTFNKKKIGGEDNKKKLLRRLHSVDPKQSSRVLSKWELELADTFVNEKDSYDPNFLNTRMYKLFPLKPKK